MARATRPAVMAKLLGKVWPSHSVEKNNTEHMVECPFCASDSAKCAVNPDKGVFQCWVCGESGPVAKLMYHLKNLKVISQIDIDAVMVGKGRARLTDAIAEYPTHLKKEKPVQYWTDTEPAVYPPHTQEILRMVCHTRAEKALRNRAIRYLKGRGVNKVNMEQLRIAVCTESSSPYFAHLFFPGLGKWGRQLRFWTTRSILPDAKPKSYHSSGKYTRFNAKQTLLNEHLVVGTTAVVCEGPFDALSVMNVTGLPACPLLGKVMHPYHYALLEERGIKDLYVCLDSDAVAATQKITGRGAKHFETVRVVRLTEGDPNDVSVETLKAAFDKAALPEDFARAAAQAAYARF